MQFLSFLVTDPLTHSHWQFLEGPLPLKKERSNTKLNTKIINVENNKKCNQKMPIKYNNNLMYAKVVFIQILKITISGVFLFLFSPLSAIVTCLIYIRYNLYLLHLEFCLSPLLKDYNLCCDWLVLHAWIYE